jgi:molybdopterin-containing oxidoreductase family iron-sulfur binding subunit
MEKRYWKGVEELNNDPEFVRLRNDEFFEHLPVDEVLQQKSESTSATSRRDFLKFLGFSVAAASLAACEAPVRKAIPYVVKPEEITLGVPNYYASTYFDGHDFCPILVKTREGRPIKIEGNNLSSLTKGGTSARVQASVLSLYDSARLNQPLAAKKPVEWNKADGEITSKLAAQSAAGKQIVVMSSSMPSPSSLRAIADFAAKYPGTRHVVYDPVSAYGILKAHESSFGKAMMPEYRFDNASVIVSIGADFLANWISPIEHARQYAATRQLRDGKKEMSRHIQIESALSLTGSNADVRYKCKPSQQGSVIASLYNKIAGLTGGTAVSSVSTPLDKNLDAVAAELAANKGKSIIVSSSNNPAEQVLVNAINQLLGNYGSTLNLNRQCNLRSSDDAAVAETIAAANSGQVGAIIFWNSNPVHTLPGFEAAMKRVALKISLSDREDETALLCDYVCPDHHYLESWNDFEPYNGIYCVSQPVIRPLFKTRQAQESLLAWAGNPVTSFHDYMRGSWQSGAFTTQNTVTSFDAFWSRSLRDGVYENANATSSIAAVSGLSGVATSAGTSISKPATGIEVILYEKTGMGNGAHANNPWLLEMPDPVSKVTWDNYFAVLPTFAEKNGWRQGTVIEVKAGNATVKGPVLLQPGMADETLAVAVGFGRKAVGKAGNNVGFNAYPFVNIKDGYLSYITGGVTVNKTVEDDVAFAATQTHHTMMGRDIVKETSLAAWIKDPAAGNPPVLIDSPYGKKTPEELDLWATADEPAFAKPNHFWGMGIDLNSCIGCGSCVIACQAENNVPVVGKDEVRRSREMHWIRIDRYYSSDTTKENAADKGLGKLDMYGEMEKPSVDNPSVVFQPVMCQHCNQAPCETVCPVAATTHSSDGLNMMAYNRCVGTRYCANNCPYKVRRFNWFRYNENPVFPYNQTDDLGKMVLNPDVVVRSRGVMEKCTMCVQRIQYGKLEAKKANRRPEDGEIVTACAQACPTNAIVFGDYNDPKSKINALHKDKRQYQLLAEIKTKPGVFYQTKVHNRSEAEVAKA